MSISKHSLTVFYLERLQPDWLPQRQRQWVRRGSGILVILFAQLLFELVIPPLLGQGSSHYVAGSMLVGLVVGLVAGVGSNLIRSILDGVIIGLGSGLGFGLVSGLVGWLDFGLVIWLVSGLVFGLVIGCSSGWLADSSAEGKPPLRKLFVSWKLCTGRGQSFALTYYRD